MTHGNFLSRKLILPQRGNFYSFLNEFVLIVEINIKIEIMNKLFEIRNEKEFKNILENMTLKGMLEFYNLSDERLSKVLGLSACKNSKEVETVESYEKRKKMTEDCNKGIFISLSNNN